MSEGDFIGRLGGQITFKAELPQEFYDKIFGNTPEEMDRMLQPGYAFDLSDGKDRTVTYIAIPKGTKPEDVEKVTRCKGCIYWRCPERGNPWCDHYFAGLRCIPMPNDYCPYGDREDEKE